MLPDMATHTFCIQPGDTYDVQVGPWGGPYVSEAAMPRPPAPVRQQMFMPERSNEFLTVEPGQSVVVATDFATFYVKGVEKPEPTEPDRAAKLPDCDVQDLPVEGMKSTDGLRHTLSDFSLIQTSESPARWVVRFFPPGRPAGYLRVTSTPLNELLNDVKLGAMFAGMNR